MPTSIPAGLGYQPCFFFPFDIIVKIANFPFICIYLLLFTSKSFVFSVIAGFFIDDFHAIVFFIMLCDEVKMT